MQKGTYVRELVYCVSGQKKRVEPLSLEIPCGSLYELFFKLKLMK